MTTPSHLSDLVATRLSRRGLLGGMAAIPLLSMTGCATGGLSRRSARTTTFASVPATQVDRVTVPEGYTARTLIAWGDPLFDTASGPLDLDALDRKEQEQRFGTHNDMLALFPVAWTFPAPRVGRRHILCANHEYFSPALAAPAARSLQDFDVAKVESLFAAMGVSVLAVEETAQGEWRVSRDATPGAGVNRRITPFTPVAFTGPAADHPWIRAASRAFNATEPDVPAGTIACGTLANCAGGQTPWGTFLTSEENFQNYFRAAGPQTTALTAARADARKSADAEGFGYRLEGGRPGLPGPAPYDLSANPTGPSVYGWVVEIDPYDPTSVPRKRTAIGRKKGENAATALARDGRAVVYQGDDQLNEFTYKFVSVGRFDPTARASNMELLDQGTLFVARFEADGTGRWLPITLDAANAAAENTMVAPFTDLGDVMVRARAAARLLGATPMDRPEDVEAIVDDRWVGEGTVLIPCTKGVESAPARPARPVREGAVDEAGGQMNIPGHVIRIQEAADDCGADRFTWDVFLMGGDPDARTAMGVTPGGRPFNQSVDVEGRPTFTGAALAAPDNLCFDSNNNVWITTDGMASVFPCNDVVLVAGTEPGIIPEVRRFMVGPVGAEITGPTFSPDERTFLAAVQHPGASDTSGVDYGATRWSEKSARPASSFPDGSDTWPRSAVVYVRRNDGGRIGS